MSAPSACLRIRPIAMSTPLWFADLRAIMSRDFGPGRLPHPRMPADIRKRRVEGVDAMRHAGEIGVQRNRHDAARFGALAIEHIELPADHLAELVGGTVRAFEHRLVVDLVAVGHRDQTPPRIEAHRIGLVIVGPVADILATLGGKQIERVPGLLQTGAQPADRACAARLGNGREGALDDPTFLAGRGFVQAAGVAFAMTHPFPAQLLPLRNDLGMMCTEIVVERDGAADPVAVEYPHEPNHAAAVAVVTGRPGRDIGYRGAGPAGARRYLLHQGE